MIISFVYFLEDDYGRFANTLGETLEELDDIIVSSTELFMTKEEVHSVLNKQFSPFIVNTSGEYLAEYKR